jgi:hypothetical protein
MVHLPLSMLRPNLLSAGEETGGEASAEVRVTVPSPVRPVTASCRIDYPGQVPAASRHFGNRTVRDAIWVTLESRSRHADVYHH